MQPESEQRRKVPGKDCDGCGKPAKHGMTDDGCNPVQRGRTVYWIDDGLAETLRNAMQKSRYWCSKQDERWSHRHQQQMLNHVDKEELVIHHGERGACGNPDCGEPTDECSHMSPVDDPRKRLPKMQPATHVAKEHE